MERGEVRGGGEGEKEVEGNEGGVRGGTRGSNRIWKGQKCCWILGEATPLI